MSAVETYATGDAVTLPSGEEVLRGKVSRVSSSSVWAVFNGNEYRFSLSQDGWYRQHGRVSDEKSPVIRKVPAEVLAAEMATRKLEWRVNAIFGLGRAWDDADKKIREKIANPENSLSSFVAEDLMIVAGTESPRRLIRQYLEKIGAAVTFGKGGYVEKILDEATLREHTEKLVEVARESYMRWYKPNSTSNAHVEIALNEHAAWLELYKEASGRV